MIDSSIRDAGRDSRLRSLLALIVRSRPYRMSSGQAAIWALSGAMIATAAVLFRAGAGDVPPVISSVHVPFWALLIAFAAAERFVVHVHFRRSAHSMSLGEIPFVFALVFAGGQPAILAGAIGRILVLARASEAAGDPAGVQLRRVPARELHRGARVPRGRRRLDRDHSDRLGGRDPRHRGQLADWRSCSSAPPCPLSEGQLGIRQVARSLRTDLAVVVANTSVGLCAATIVYEDWKTAILMAIPVAGMFISFRAYVTERQRHERVEFLYRAARALSHAPEIGPALEGLLAAGARRIPGRGRGDHLLLAGRRRRAARRRVRANGAASVLERVEPDDRGAVPIADRGPRAPEPARRPT